MRLGFQCVGILYADLGTSPLYVYSNTFKYGIGHEDDVLGVLSLIIYSFLLFAMIKIIFIALYANDEGEGACVHICILECLMITSLWKLDLTNIYDSKYSSGGTFALYSLISRYAKVALIPNQQAEDELVSSHRKPSATFRRAQWMKNLLESSKPAKLTLFFLTIFATALAISDCILTPPISGTLPSNEYIYSLGTFFLRESLGTICCSSILFL